MYGPSAATGLGGASTAFMLTGSPLWAGLALFTLAGATFAAQRTLPAFHKRRRAHRA